jgi:hypothetical protein
LKEIPPLLETLSIHLNGHSIVNQQLQQNLEMLSETYSSLNIKLTNNKHHQGGITQNVLFSSPKNNTNAAKRK